jgi:hypothetical protein
MSDRMDLDAYRGDRELDRLTRFRDERTEFHPT